MPGFEPVLSSFYNGVHGIDNGESLDAIEALFWRAVKESFYDCFNDLLARRPFRIELFGEETGAEKFEQNRTDGPGVEGVPVCFPIGEPITGCGRF